MRLNLGRPTQADAQEQMDALRDWVRAWQECGDSGEVQWRERQWPKLGRQRLPVHLLLASPEQAAAWAGEEARWGRAKTRFQHLIDRRASLRDALPRHFDVLADYSDRDFDRLAAVLAWLEEHRRSNLLPRQLPIPGLDTKWMEARKGLILDLLGALAGLEPNGSDFFQRCGLKSPPSLVRIRILDADLRSRVGGLRDLTVPVDELAKLAIPVQCVFVVENLQTGLAFEDLRGAVVIMGLGYGVDVLRGLPWIGSARVIYWGDIDTDGFAILNRARMYFPQMQSLMMDAETLHRYRDLCVEEKQQHGAETLPHLSREELDVYHGLKKQRWGYRLRLEQERISWAKAWEAIKSHSNVG
jgi:hypothetical protein